MIVDTSALMALLLDEPEAEHFNLMLASADQVSMSAGSFLELAITATRRSKPFTLVTIDKVIAQFHILIVPVTFEQAQIARQAYLAYGRGNHPAGLNFGDCFAYALAKETDKPLLYKGSDFAMTDIRAAAAGIA